MPRLSQKTQEARKYQAEQDTLAAARINDVMRFFHAEVLHCFIPLTMVRTLLLIIFLILGYSAPRAAKMTGFCAVTVRMKRDLFEKGKLQELFSRKPGSGRKSACASKEDEIIEELESKDYRSVKQILAMIQEKIHSSVSLSAVKNLLHKLGFNSLKCGSLPAKADPDEQRRFYEETQKPIMEKAQRGEVVACYGDASHFVLGNTHLGRVWCRVRRFLLTFTGRVRYNVLGALNFVTKEMTTVTNDSYITATQVVELLDKLAYKYAGLPIYLFLDNAKYQRCKLVQEHAKALGINLVFLPPYSPNLNLIERFWKLVKKELGSAYFSNFADFCKNIDLLCSTTHTDLKAEMDTLIGEKVQLFDGMTLKSPNSFEQPHKAA